LGDFNYRLNYANDSTRACISRKDYETLIRHDQLTEQKLNKLAFEGFDEGPLLFDPTYKYDNNTTFYDTSEKQRTPSWTDRILYKGPMKQVLLIEYNRGECLISDHRPVRALFSVQVAKIDREKKDDLRKALYKSFTENPPAKPALPARPVPAIPLVKNDVSVAKSMSNPVANSNSNGVQRQSNPFGSESSNSNSLQAVVPQGSNSNGLLIDFSGPADSSKIASGSMNHFEMQQPLIDIEKKNEKAWWDSSNQSASINSAATVTKNPFETETNRHVMAYSPAMEPTTVMSNPSPIPLLMPLPASSFQPSFPPPFQASFPPAQPSLPYPAQASFPPAAQPTFQAAFPPPAQPTFQATFPSMQALESNIPSLSNPFPSMQALQSNIPSLSNQLPPSNRKIMQPTPLMQAQIQSLPLGNGSFRNSVPANAPMSNISSRPMSYQDPFVSVGSNEELKPGKLDPARLRTFSDFN
jgi:hypothetical protein